jgi:hypothetical protein
MAAEAWSAEAWEDGQLDEARIHGETRDAVKRLLRAWKADTGANLVDSDVAFEAFCKLARGITIVVPDDPAEQWQKITSAGNLHGRDIVRVQGDAYIDEVGRMHNGRRGVVLAVRYGDVVIRYTDGRQPPFDGVHHPPHKLEKRVK